MHYLKMLGLAAVAAMALTAFLGAGSASATVLCKTTNETSHCASGWHYGSGTEIHAVLESGSHATLNGFWTDVTCRSSTINASTTSTGGSSSTVTGAFEMSLTQCSCAGGSVGTAHATILASGTFEVHHLAGTDNGTVTGAVLTVTYNCTSLGAQCRFGLGEGLHFGILTGGHEATLQIGGETVRTSGTGDEGLFVCGSTADFEAQYDLTSPETLFVSAS